MSEPGPAISSTTWTGLATDGTAMQQDRVPIGMRRLMSVPRTRGRRQAAACGAGGLLGAMLGYGLPAEVISAPLETDGACAHALAIGLLFYVGVTVVGFVVAHVPGVDRQRPVLVGVGRMALLLGVAQAAATIVDFSNAAPRPPVRAWIRPQPFTYDLNGFFVTTADGRGFDLTDDRDRDPRLSPGRCLLARPYVGLSGRTWLQIVDAAPRPAGDLAWPIAQARCFSDRPLESLGER